MAHPPLISAGSPLTAAERTRYARHLLLPGVGASAQERLRAARVLVIGAGGLGSPALLYLAAAGVGTLGIVDDDVVDLTNLQRQIIHTQERIGQPKTASAAAAIAALNPDVEVVQHQQWLTREDALATFAAYDVVVDGADNFPTRYLVGAACAALGIPHVWGSVHRFDGQASVWWAGEGPCYACVFPVAPPPDAVPSCATGGVLGAVCAAVGAVLSTETIKLLTGIGEPLVGRLMLHDALAQTWSPLPVRARPDCRVCGSGADLTDPFASLADDGCMPGAPLTSLAPDSADLPQVSVRELAAQLAEGLPGALLVDVREPGEREVAVIPGAVSVPLDLVRSGAWTAPAGLQVLVHCKTGGRSAQAVALLRARGVDAINVAGGVLAWADQVDPMVARY